jgi:hypothetical protein
MTTSGFSPAAGAVMLAFDFSHLLTLQVGSDGDHFVVHNAAALTQTGVVWMLTAP